VHSGGHCSERRHKPHTFLPKYSFDDIGHNEDTTGHNNTLLLSLKERFTFTTGKNERLIGSMPINFFERNIF